MVVGRGRAFQADVAQLRVVQPDEAFEFGVARLAGQGAVRERSALVAFPAHGLAQGRWSTSTLGGSVEGFGRDERRTIEKAAPPAASTATAAPASTHGRGLRRRDRRAWARASGKLVTTSWAAASSCTSASWALRMSRASRPC